MNWYKKANSQVTINMNDYKVSLIAKLRELASSTQLRQDELNQFKYEEQKLIQLLNSLIQRLM